MITTTSTPV